MNNLPKEKVTVEIEPLIKGGKTMIATVSPIKVYMSGADGEIELISGYEIEGNGKKGCCHNSEMSWLLESNQYRIIKPTEVG